jgi:hypothetical protein
MLGKRGFWMLADMLETNIGCVLVNKGHIGHACFLYNSLKKYIAEYSEVFSFQ